MTETLHAGGGFTVTTRTLTTPRRTYDLSRIEHVSIRQPLFLLALAFTGVGLNGFVVSFWGYLYPGEKIGLVSFSIITLALSWMIGTLRVHSLALRDGEHGVIIGPIGRLKAVKAAVDQAIDLRVDR